MRRAWSGGGQARSQCSWPFATTTACYMHPDTVEQNRKLKSSTLGNTNSDLASRAAFIVRISCEVVRLLSFAGGNRTSKAGTRLRLWTLDIYSNKFSVHNISEIGTTSIGTTSISKINNQTRIIPGIYVPFGCKYYRGRSFKKVGAHYQIRSYPSFESSRQKQRTCKGADNDKCIRVVEVLCR